MKPNYTVQSNHNKMTKTTKKTLKSLLALASFVLVVIVAFGYRVFNIEPRQESVTEAGDTMKSSFLNTPIVYADAPGGGGAGCPGRSAGSARVRSWLVDSVPSAKGDTYGVSDSRGVPETEG